jgi:hypothetical protein
MRARSIVSCKGDALEHAPEGSSPAETHDDRRVQRGVGMRLCKLTWATTTTAADGHLTTINSDHFLSHIRLRFDVRTTFPPSS